MVGKENAGGGDCSGHEKGGSRKEYMKARGQRRQDWQLYLQSAPEWLGKEDILRTGSWGRQVLLSELKPNNLLFRLS